MSKLKYKVGDKAGPFEIIRIDFEDQILPYKIQWPTDRDHNNLWFNIETTNSIFGHYAKSELLEKKAESQRKTISYWKDKFESRTEFFNQLKLENRTLKESNVELRGANDEMKAEFEKDFASFERIRNSNQKEILDLHEELKTVKSHLDLRIKGIEALESDSKKNRIEIELLKADHASIWDEYNSLDQSRKHSTVLAWVGWIMFFISIFGMIFLRN
jgi:hypothetical protein